MKVKLPALSPRRMTAARALTSFQHPLLFALCASILSDSAGLDAVTIWHLAFGPEVYRIFSVTLTGRNCDLLLARTTLSSGRYPVYSVDAIEPMLNGSRCLRQLQCQVKKILDQKSEEMFPKVKTRANWKPEQASCDLQPDKFV